MNQLSEIQRLPRVQRAIRRSPDSALERTVVVGVCSLLVWLPLPLGSNRDWSAALFIAVVSLLTALWALARLKNSTWTGDSLKSASPMLMLLGLAQLWVGAQLYFGWTLDTGATYQRLLLGLGYCFLFMLTVDLFDSRDRMKLLLAVLIASGAAQAFYGSIMALSGIDWGFLSKKTAYMNLATGTFVNRNHLAGYLEMTSACAIGLLLAQRDQRRFLWRSLLDFLNGPKAIIRLGLVIMVIGVVMTRSRMGNVALFSSMLLTAGLLVLGNRQHLVRNLILFISILLIDVAVVNQYFGLERVKERITETRFESVVEDGRVVAHANEIRDNVWITTAPMIMRYWPNGIGAGAFEAVFPTYSGPDITLHFDHAHNDYIELIVEFGLPGFGFLAAFVLIGLYKAMRALWYFHSRLYSGTGFAATMGILALLVHSLADFNLQIPANAATFIVICAVGAIAAHKGKRMRERVRG